MTTSPARIDRGTPDRRRGLPRVLRLAAVALPAMLLAAACSPADEQQEDMSPPAAEVPAGLESFYEQDVTFEACDGYGTTPTHQSMIDGTVAAAAAECARVQVPLDYDDPDGETGEIALIRVPARGDDPIGSLLLNPGGPGGSGIYVGAATAGTLAASPLTERFDLVGFDPRGVGASTPAIDCHTDAEADDSSYPLSAVGLSTEFTAADTQAIYERCAELSGGPAALASVSTRNAARDMDVLRAVLGDEKLSYLGQSYGTRLGAIYAEQFPQNVRAMLLDGAGDPTQATHERRVAAYTGFQRAFDEMVAFCIEQGDCPLGDDPDRAVEVFQDLVRPLRADPLPAGPQDQFELTFDGATSGVTAGLYISEAWPGIIAGIAEVQQGRGDTLTGLSHAFGQRDPDGSWPNVPEANYAINCMDEDRMTPREVATLRDEIYEAAPYLDPGVDISAGARDTCEAWPEQPDLGFPHAVGIEGLPATLVVSLTGDATTPHAGAIVYAEALGSSLLTVEGEQHTVVTQGNQPCVDEIAAAYLIDLEVPDDGATCQLLPPATS